jgi:hypothetical protein
MAKISAKDCVISCASVDISTYVESYEIQWAQDVPEVTGFSDGWQNFVCGMPVVGFTLNLYWDDGTLLPVLLGLMATPDTCIITPETGGSALSGTFMVDGINPQGTASSGAIKLGPVHFSASGSVIATFA